jgi:hypothetical protein
MNRRFEFGSRNPECGIAAAMLSLVVVVLDAWVGNWAKAASGRRTPRRWCEMFRAGSDSTFAFVPLPGLRRDKQVVDISPKVAKSCVVSRLIYRGLRRKQAFFDPFLTCKGVDFSALTENLPDFFAGEACTHYETGSHD